MGEEPRPPLTKMVLNNFMVKQRPVARQARTHTINGLVHQTRRLRQKAEKDEQCRAKLEAKVDRLVKEILFLKTVPPHEMMKFALLNKKSFVAVGSNPKAKTEERALCRVVEHSAVRAAIAALKEAHADWTSDLPHLIKSLGIRHRDKKLLALKRKGKLEAYLQKEEKNHKLLQELTGIDLKIGESSAFTSLITEGEERRRRKRSGGSSVRRKRKREQGMDKSSKVIKKVKSKKESKGVVEEGADDGGAESESEERDDDEMGARESQGNASEDGGKVTETMGETNGVDGAIGEEPGEGDDAESGDSDGDDGEQSPGSPADEVQKMGKEGKKMDIKTNMEQNGQDKNQRKLKPGKELSAEKRIGKKMAKKRADEKGTNNNNDNNTERAASHHPQPVVIKAAKVKQLDLERIKQSGLVDEFRELENGTPDDNGDDEDDDFFEQKKKKKRSSFFVGDDDDGDNDDGDSDEGDSDEGDGDGGSDGDSTGVVDTSKYFKRNLYRERKDERGRGGVRRGREGGRGRGRGQKQDEGRGRGMKRGQGRGWKQEGRNRFTDRKGGGGEFGDIGGGKDDDHSRTRTEGKESFGDRSSGGRGGGGGGWFGDRRGGGGGWFGDRRGGGGDRGRGGGRDRGRGGGRDRGGGGGRDRGRGGWEDRGGGGGRDRGRGGGRDRGRGGWEDRGRGGRGGRFGPRGRGLSHMDSDNPNFIPVTNGVPGMTLPKPATTTPTIPGFSMLHPSWMAKKKEQHQRSTALSAFQGKHVVFD